MVKRFKYTKEIIYSMVDNDKLIRKNIIIIENNE